MRRAERQFEPDPLREPVHLVELARPRHDGRSGNGRVVLGPRAYLQPHTLRHERLQMGAGRPGKLVYDYQFNLIRKFTYDLGVEFAEQPVDVTRGAAPGLVLSRRQRPHTDVVLTHGFDDAIRDPPYAEDTDGLRVPNAYLPQPFRLYFASYTDPGHDQRTEVVSLPRLVDPQPRRNIENWAPPRNGL